MIPYRADVDGLRGLAVLAVVLYHAGLGCPGGYAGVDVFFVISGFLITSILLEKRLSLGQFWEGRCRRLVPALGLMMLVVTAWGAWGLALELRGDLFRSALAQACLSSNVYFWHTTGYWDGPAELKPLLHTWSLAVEEQFYLLYPLVLLALRSRARVAVALLGLTVLSLACNLYHFGSSASFYLLPMRAWELALGGLLAAWPWPRQSSCATELAGCLGIALVLGPMFVLDRETPYPGYAALVPCWGTLLVLGARPQFAGYVLSTRPLVALGLLSYSWYLWHWPVLVALRASLPAPPGPSERLLAVLASLGLAALSWRFVEQPFRQRRWLPRRGHLFGVASLLWFAVVIGAAHSLATQRAMAVQGDVVPGQAPARNFYHAPFADVRPIPPCLTNLAQAQRGELQPMGVTDPALPATFLLWGDSHAQVARAEIDLAARAAGRRGFSALGPGRGPLGSFGWGNEGQRADQVAYSGAVMRFIEQHRVSDVILCARWCAYPRETGFAEALRKTLKQLEDWGCTVWVVEQVPEQIVDVPQMVHWANQHKRDPNEFGVTLAYHREVQDDFEDWLERYRQPHTRVLDPAPIIVGPQGRARLVADGRVLYRDQTHLSAAGAHMLEPLWQKIFAK